MREIKLRAWNKKVGFWYDNTLLLLSHLINDPDVEVVDYIGIKDKNGVEIYEGSIVRWEKKHYPNAVAGSTLGKVIWFSDGARYCVEVLWPLGVEEAGGDEFYDLQNVGTVGIDDMYAGDIEVIGNIYENPELLRESAK